MTTRTVGSNPNVFAAQLQNGLDAAQRQLVKAAVSTVAELTKVATAQLEQLTKGAAAGAAQGASPAAGTTPAAGTSPSTESAWGGQCKSLNDVFNLALNGAPSAPTPVDASHPSGSLKADANGVITTPGGYKIEATKQHEWKVTGPDGKETRVWGDPHVAESDGGKWDFKRDSTFVLGDGTRINCATTPYGNGMTVTKGLEIISGNDRVEITGIDQGKGKTGQVTQDGFAHANSFGGKDVFVMGKETDDWSFTGKEVVGSNNGGESFKLGNDLAAGTPNATPSTTPTKPNSRLDQVLDLFRNLSKVFDSLKNLTNLLGQRANQNPGIVPPGRDPVESRRRGALERSFSQIGRMLDTVARFQNLTRSIDFNRNRYLA
jgi:hypothetical protein